MTSLKRAAFAILVWLLVSVAPAGATPFAYVGNVAVPGSFVVIDVATNSVVTQVSVGDEFECCHGGRGVAVSPSGDRAYLALNNSGGVLVLDASTNSVVTTIPTPNRVPQGLAINSTGTRLYVTAYQDTGGGGNANSAVLVVDPTSNSVLTTIPVPDGPLGIVVSPDGSRVYTANATANSITTISTATNTVLGSVPVPNGPFGASIPTDLVVTPSGGTLYVAKFNTYEVAVFDTATSAIVANINTDNGPNGVAINPAGTRVYVGHNDASDIKVIDTATNTVVDTIAVQAQAGLSVTPDGTRLFANQSSVPAGVHVIDTATNAVVTTVTGFRPTAFGTFIGPICPSACNDGNPCTTDGCNSVSGCTHTNNTGPCASDGNSCTTDVCDGAGSCTHPDVPAGSSCDDGLFCNGTDTCNATGGCVNHSGDPCPGGPECARTCNEATDNCFDPASTACATDGNVCTDDHCNGAGACVHTNNTAPCNDGLFCNGTDTCAGGVCGHSGDPCAGGPECDHTCNEASDNCFDANTTACTADTNPCTLDRCNGAGACTHPVGNAGAVCRPSAGQCDVAETCTGASATCPTDGFKPDGTACDDGNACTTDDACTSGACSADAPTVCPACQTCVSPSGCAVGPKPSCLAVTAPQAAFVEVKGVSPSTGNKVAFKWSKGAATTFAQLGDPSSTDDYALCVFSSTGSTSSLVLQATAPAGGVCAGPACWKRLGSATLPKGWKYGDQDATPDGLTGLQASSAATGKAKLQVKGKGGNLAIAPFSSLAGAISAQVQADNGTCWTASCSRVIKNAAGNYKCKGE